MIFCHIFLEARKKSSLLIKFALDFYNSTTVTFIARLQVMRRASELVIVKPLKQSFRLRAVI